MPSQGQAIDKQRRISTFNQLYNSEDFAIMIMISCNKRTNEGFGFMQDISCLRRCFNLLNHWHQYLAKKLLSVPITAHF